MRGGPDLTVAAHPGHSNRHATESKHVLEERFGAGPTTFGVYYIYISLVWMICCFGGVH